MAGSLPRAYAVRVQDLFDDYEQTTRQQDFLLTGSRALLVPTRYAKKAPEKIHRSNTRDMHARLVKLYDQRLRGIHDNGIARLSLWSDLHQEHLRPCSHQKAGAHCCVRIGHLVPGGRLHAAKSRLCHRGICGAAETRYIAGKGRAGGLGRHRSVAEARFHRATRELCGGLRRVEKKVR